jgi:hypothetical protein
VAGLDARCRTRVSLPLSPSLATATLRCSRPSRRAPLRVGAALGASEIPAAPVLIPDGPWTVVRTAFQPPQSPVSAPAFNSSSVETSCGY